MNKTLALTALLAFVSTETMAMDPDQKRELMTNGRRFASDAQYRKELIKKFNWSDDEAVMETVKRASLKEMGIDPSDSSDSSSEEEINISPAPIVSFMPTNIDPAKNNVYINYNITVNQSLRNSKGKVRIKADKPNK